VNGRICCDLYQGLHTARYLAVFYGGRSWSVHVVSYKRSKNKDYVKGWKNAMEFIKETIKNNGGA